MNIYSAEQLTVARTIFKVGLGLKVPEIGIAMALSAALVESNLRNLTFGDRDSLGVFQQRRAWGTDAQRLNVDWSTTAFFVGTRNSTGWYPGLTSFPLWGTKSFRDAITAVQHPAAEFEHRYEDRRAEAIALCERLVKEALPPPPPKPPKPPPPPPKPTYDRTKTKSLQLLLELPLRDGKWGPGTDQAASRMRAVAFYDSRSRATLIQVQVVIDTKPDGKWGPKTAASLVAWVKQLQSLLKVPADGKWGVKTDAAFMAFRKANLNKF